MRVESFLPGVLLSGATVLVLASPATAQVVEVTGVRVESTSTGLQIILETTGDRVPQVFTSSFGETTIVDITNTQLRLTQGSSFRQDNPAEGIESIAVTSLDSNSIRLTVTGTSAMPMVQATDPANPLTFEVMTSTDVAEDPFPDSEPEAVPEPETPTTSETQEDSLPEIEPEVVPDPETPTTLETQADQELDILEIIVTATRTAERLIKVPRSITVLDRQDIDEQTTVSTDLGDVLAKTVPGLGPPTSGSSARSIVQNLRGREVAILIDGVPQTSNYGLTRDLRMIDPNIVERVEVVRGPSAIYGSQATGGAINIITRSPTQDAFSIDTGVSFTGSLTHLSDSISNRQYFGLSQKEGIIDYSVSVVREDNGAIFDASGDRIPDVGGGGTLEAREYSALGKLGLDITDTQRLQLTANYFVGRQDTSYISDPIVLELEGRPKARALRAVNGNYEGTVDAGDENLVISLRYTNDDILGSQLQAQTYYQEYTSAIGGTDFRGGFFDIIARQRAQGDKWGGQLQVETPLTSSGSARLLWGVDYVDENNVAPFDEFDPVAFDERGVFRKIATRTFVPAYSLSQLGLFAQGNWDPTDWLRLTGGVRHERIALSVDDYTSFFGRDIEGGDVDLNGTVFNAGSVVNLTPEFGIFANFAQGFSIPSPGGVLRNPPEDFNNVGRDLTITEPIKVNNYEIGVRGLWPQIQVSLAGFYNYSDLGAGFIFVDGISRLVRAPERRYGVEATADWQPGWNLSLGGTLSWTEGESDLEDSGDYLAASSFDITPLKATAYLEHQTTPSWSNRLQFLYSGNRNRAFDDEVDNTAIDAYFLVDYVGSIQLGAGTLNFGVENLLNAQYFTAQSQVLAGFVGTSNTAGEGRTLRIGYSLRF
ncbi:TonB-dependent receptor domain-containing protein [Oscillatoria acuminata]|uniref:Outer membrane receptor protein n=1 Tax=Oscillatoria acuminata PCC 6304 TaxID=56110 RepID=K9TJW0_9CYAN|nr:TonB-dependent receptor [Oscillatoria acuminata]AFY82815.1 outer membrane receptor protein [Oscillatoria acuminata PCC 6304]